MQTLPANLMSFSNHHRLKALKDSCNEKTLLLEYVLLFASCHCKEI